MRRTNLAANLLVAALLCVTASALWPASVGRWPVGAMPFPPQAAQAQADGPTYVVQPGDTLFRIAQVFGTTVDELASANGIVDAASIYPGQELVIPGYPGVSGQLVFETVALGDSLQSLSLKTGVAIDALQRLNRVVKPDRLHAGQGFITPDPNQQITGLPTASRLVVEAGEPILEAAARLGSNPWAMRQINQQRWAVPGQMLWAPGGDQPTSALPPEISGLSVGPLPAVQGVTEEVQLQAGSAADLSIGIGPWQLSLAETSPGSFVGLQGINALTDVGLLDFRIASSQFEFVEPIEVASGGYGSEALIVPPETVDPDITGPEDALIAQVVSEFTPEQRWSGAFDFPTDYHDTFPSFFGTRRSYNGSGYDYYHTGLDLYGSTSTPIYAPAAGRVAFTDQLTVRGNVTYVDHGLGVFSGFLHQSQILVAPGDLVERGQLIGYVGGTGRVTGPHLHWEIWVGGVPVNPLGWTEQAYP